MILARLLTLLLGVAPPDVPMARLLVLDEEAFIRRVRTPRHDDSDGSEIRRSGRRGAGRTAPACACLASPGGRTP